MTTRRYPKIAEINQLGSNTINSKDKPIKPDFNQFLEGIGQILEDKNNRKQISDILKLIKDGYKNGGGSKKNEELFNILVKWEHFWKFATILAFHQAKGVAKNLASQLMLSIRTRAKEECRYPMSELYNNGQAIPYSRRITILRKWLEKGLKATNFDHDCARQALICIMLNETEDSRLEVSLLLLEHLPGIKKRPSGEKTQIPSLTHNEIPYFNILSDIFQSDISKQKNKINQVVHVLRPCNELQQPLIRQIVELEGNLGEEKEERIRLSTELSEMSLKLEATAQEGNVTERKYNEIVEEMQFERQKAIDLKKILTEKHDQEISSLVYKYSSNLLHEVNEAKIALTMNPPDTDIALNMISRIEEYLKRMGG